MNTNQRLAITAAVALSLALVSRPGAQLRPQSGDEAEDEARASAPAQNGTPVPGDIPAARTIADPHPVFNGVAVDPAGNLVVATDPNRKSLLLYDRARSQGQTAASVPIRQIIGPATEIGMVAGVVLDPQRREIYAANNDIEDTVVVMSYDAGGNARPARVLSVPHQAWGLALGREHDQLAVTVQLYNAVVFYRRGAQSVEPPVRVLRGPNTGLADPHGIFWDEARHEIVVANHGNFRGLARNTGSGCAATTPADDATEAGEFQPPSVRIYSADAHDDQRPLRTIQGPRTGLDWPMGVAVDAARHEIAVANNGDDSVLVFDGTRGGNLAPLRIIRGPRTGIHRPMGLAIDATSGEIWVANYGDHSALAFDRAANGDVLPRRVIRSAPPGTPSPGFGNPMALAYDSKRQQILVPN